MTPAMRKLLIGLLAALALLYVVNAFILAKAEPSDIPYSEFVAKVQADEFQKVE
ncbi:MAG: ATP-dependent metallopeptidase FtsH/Yme1/Tma family protein, partial [Gammaproteobacteria bacterium]